MKLSREEQETIINKDAMGRKVSVYTSEPREIMLLDDMCEKYPEHYRLVKVSKLQDGEIVGKFYEIADRSLVRFVKPRSYTDEAMEAMRQRGRNLFLARMSKRAEGDNKR